MITVESYLRDRTGKLVPADDAALGPVDELSIEGAIHLRVGQVDIMDLSLWDYVDQLWAYITDMISRLTKENEAHTYFPDQPVKLTFRRVGTGKILVSCEVNEDVRSAVANEEDLFGALRTAGVKFFTRMSNLVPSNASTYQEYIDDLSKSNGHLQ